MHTSNPSRLSLAEQCSYCQPMELAPARLVRGNPRARRGRRRRALPLALALETLEQRTLMSISPLAPDFPVGTFSPTAAQLDDNGGSRIAAAANGDFVVVWQNESNSAIELEFRLFDSSGNPLTGATAVDGTATDPVIQKSSAGGISQLQASLDPRYFAVAMDAAGDFVIAWQGQSQIFAEQFSSAGALQGSLITVSTGTANTEPSVAMDAAGDFTVAWIDDQAASVNLQGMTPKSSYQYEYYNSQTYAHQTKTQTTAGTQYTTPANYVSGIIEARRFDSAGTGGDTLAVNDSPVTTPNGKASTSFSTDLSPSVAMDSTGDFVVGWDQSTYAPVKIQTAASAHSSYKGYYLDQNYHKHYYTLNSYTAASFTYGLAVSGFKTQYQRYNAPASQGADPAPNGATGTALAFNSSPKQFVSGSDVAVSMDSAGDFAITSDLSYARETARTPTGQPYTYSYYQSSSVITAKRYSDTGAAVGGAITVAKTSLSPAPGEQGSIPSPLLDGALPAMNSSGELTVAWNQYTYNSSGNDFTGIFARRYSSSGSALDASSVQLGEADGASATNPDISYAQDGTIDLTYSQLNPQDAVYPVVAEQYHDTTATHVKLIAPPKTLTAGVNGSLAVDIDDAKGKPVAAENGDLTLTVLTGPDTQSQFTTTATAGIAAFSDLNFTTAGVYTFEIQYGSLTVTTGKITVKPGPAVAMTILQQPPATSLVGRALSPAVRVEMLDQFDNVATGDKSKVTLNLTNSTVSMSGAVAIVSKGIATFGAIKIGAPDTFTLTAHDANGAIATAQSASFSVVSQQLKITKQPTTLTAGSANAHTPVVVQVEGPTGKPIAGVSTITLTVAGGPENGTAFTAVTNTQGTATFTNVVLDVAGAHTLVASDGSILPATAGKITVSPGAAAQLAIVSAPATGTAGASNGPITVQVQDAFGNLIATDKSTVSLTVDTHPDNATAAFSTLTLTAAKGIAKFTSFPLTIAGAYTFLAQDGNLQAGVSASETISAAAAAKLAFLQAPTDVSSGANFSPPVQVAVEDRFGNIATQDGSAVALVVNGSGTLAGTATTLAQGGVATFTSLDPIGSGTCTLSATDGVLTPATSSAFNISSVTQAVFSDAFELNDSDRTAGATLDGTNPDGAGSSTAWSVGTGDSFDFAQNGTNGYLQPQLPGDYSYGVAALPITLGSGVYDLSANLYDDGTTDSTWVGIGFLADNSTYPLDNSPVWLLVESNGRIAGSFISDSGRQTLIDTTVSNDGWGIDNPPQIDLIWDTVNQTVTIKVNGTAILTNADVSSGTGLASTVADVGVVKDGEPGPNAIIDNFSLTLTPIAT